MGGWDGVDINIWVWWAGGGADVNTTIFPSNDSHKYVDLPDKVRSALCGVGRVNFHICGGYCTCVWRAVYMCVFAYMYICVCIAIVHIPTVLIFAIC